MIPLPRQPRTSAKSIRSWEELARWGTEMGDFVNGTMAALQEAQRQLAEVRNMLQVGGQPTTAKQGIVFTKGGFTPGNLVSAVDASGKILQDAGAASANAVTGPGSATVGDVAVFNNTNGRVLSDTGVVAANLIAGPASATNGDLAAFDGTTGKLEKDSGVPMAWFDQSVATTGTPQFTRMGVGVAADGTAVLSVNDAVSAPTATLGVPAPNQYYGTSDSTMLGVPSAWLRVRVAGTNRKVPLY